MKRINIREALLELDRKTDCRYDLTTLYEACKLDDDDKNKLVKYIDAYDHPATINKFLTSKCDAISEGLADDDVSDMKIVDEINDGGDRTLWNLMDKFEDEDLQLKELKEEVDPEVLQGRLDNIDYAMNHYAKDSFFIDDVQGSGTDYKVTYNGVTVDVTFDTDWEELTYYINGKGPYCHSSYEYIVSDIMNFVDYNHLGQSDDEVDESLTEDVDTSNVEAQIKEVVNAFMAEVGYEADEIESYTAVEIKDTDNNMIQVEVRAELGYDDLMELCDKLNPIVEALDHFAYFEPVTSGIARAFIRKDQSQDIVDEEAVNQWTNKIYDCASMEDLRQVYATFKDHVDNQQYTDGTVSAVLDVVHKKADMLNESLTEDTKEEYFVGDTETGRIYYNDKDAQAAFDDLKKSGVANPVKMKVTDMREDVNDGWIKRWDFLDKYYKDDLVISKISSPTNAWHLEKVDSNGLTIEHLGNYNSLEAAKAGASKKNESKLTLSESDDTDILYDMEDYDEDNTTVTAGNSFIEDGATWTWFKQCGDTVHLDFDNWAVWWAYRPEVEDDEDSDAISGFFVVDTDTGFIDWGPCDTVKEAQEFLQSKVNDWENDDIDESKPVKESYRQDTPDNVYKVGDRVAQRWTDEFNVGTVTDIKEEEGTQYKVEWDYSEGPNVEWLYGTDISLWIEEENIDESKSIKEAKEPILVTDELENYVIEALGIDHYTQGFMDTVINFINPYREQLLNFEYMILRTDDFNDNDDLTDDLIIAQDNSCDVVVYKNIFNVKFDYTTNHKVIRQEESNSDDSLWVMNESIKEGVQAADEWYLKINPEDSEGAEELKGLFIDDVIKDKDNLDKYGFSDRLKGILDKEFERYSPMIKESIGDELEHEDILDWLDEHNTAYEDAEHAFGDVPLKDVPTDELISWIQEHDQLYNDFINYFYKDFSDLDDSEPITEASAGFQKEFYKDYVILKNRAGDGWDVYSYTGTPEKVMSAHIEEEGCATLDDAKAFIDSLSESLTEDADSDLGQAANKVFEALKEYGAKRMTKYLDTYKIYWLTVDDDGVATLVNYAILEEGFKEVAQYGNEPNVTDYVNEAGDINVKLLIYNETLSVEISKEDASQYNESVDKDLIHCTECGKKLNDKGYCETEGCPNGTLKEGIEKYIIIAKEDGLNLYYNATDDNFGTDMKAATQYEERAVALDDYKAVKDRYPTAYIRSTYDIPLLNKPSKKEGFEEDEWDDDELASIYGGDTKYDMPDGVETPEETEARLAKEHALEEGYSWIKAGDRFVIDDEGQEPYIVVTTYDKEDEKDLDKYERYIQVAREDNNGNFTDYQDMEYNYLASLKNKGKLNFI